MRRLAPMCLALAAALLGCSSGSGPGTGGAPAGPSETAVTSDGPAAKPQVTFADRLPIARYSYTADEAAGIESAQQVLTKRCLRTFGITYKPVKPEDDTSPSADRRYGLSSASEAARLGYHPDIGPLPAGPDLPQDALRVFYGNRGAEPGTAEKVVYKGREVPSNGCFGHSVAQLAKKYDAPEAAEVARVISTQSYKDSLTDPSVMDAFRNWSACMRSSGFRYTTPLEPANNKEFQGKDISAKEKETARADVRCKENTDLLDIWFKAESALQKAEIDKNSKTLQELLTAHRQKTEAARRIVAEG
ncbi:hypothetical protein [Streptomyces sp. SAI-041]|uniref:hypothetical protein n=1 Tax=Streptomyces sp. SAI-041 TaxID=2940548 RepID=UPI002476AB35|nr:hypothetical protein [Streptomyces sp. SAI-041]MDH6546480.1 hypothetical protein [Streptomyces sp. SAI-041]